mgnify:CR=1 FL=1
MMSGVVASWLMMVMARTLSRIRNISQTFAHESHELIGTPDDQE